MLMHGGKTVRYNQYDGNMLQRRSKLATRLKYGETQSIMAARMASRASSIVFPNGVKPIPDLSIQGSSATGALPEVDVIAMMDTAAEAQAMSDVLTPGIETTKWHAYTRNFKAKFLPQIGPIGPSRESNCLGKYCVTRINDLKVLVYKTELHMHEDAKKLPDGSYSLPIKAMFTQMIDEARPRTFLTTGTSGGVYGSMHLGDVVVSRGARFDCMKDFRDAPFNNQLFKSNWTVPKRLLPQAERLMQSFADHLTGDVDPKGTPPNPGCSCASPTYPTRIYRDGTDKIPEFHPILTTDFFEFGTNTNHLDRMGMAVEMDDACLGLACSELSAPPQWACVRNLSDPAINGKLGQRLQESCAEYYYTKFGYWTTVMSALTTWSIIAGM